MSSARNRSSRRSASRPRFLWLGRQPQVVGLGHRELDEDRVHRGDLSEKGRLRFPHEVPRVDQDLADDAADRRGDPRVAQVQLRLRHRRFRRFHRGLGELDLGALDELGVTERRVADVHARPRDLLLGPGGVQVLLGNGPRLGERHVPGDVGLGLFQIGATLLQLGARVVHHRGVLRAREVGVGLGELGPRGLERGLVLGALELEQDLPLLDLAAFLVVHTLQHAGHARAHVHRRDALGARDEVPADRHRLPRHLGDHHRRRRRRRRSRALGVLAGLGVVARGRGEQQDGEAAEPRDPGASGDAPPARPLTSHHRAS